MPHNAPITPEQFATLCDDLWRDRAELAPLNPALNDKQLALWLLYGSLQSLLSFPEDYAPEIRQRDQEFYQACVEGLLIEQFEDSDVYVVLLRGWLRNYCN